MTAHDPTDESIFLAALDIADPAERAGVPGPGLRRRRRPCGGGSRRCSQAHAEAGSFLEQPAGRPGRRGDRPATPTARPPAARAP